MVPINKTYYIYRLINETTNEPFYIGCSYINEVGRTYKTRYKRAFYFKKSTPVFKQIISENNFTVDILYECDSLTKAYEKEIEFIKLYGRLCDNSGTLCNLNPGGLSTIDNFCFVGAKANSGVLNKKSKTCYVYNFKGDFLNSYPSFNNCAKTLNLKKQNILDSSKFNFFVKQMYFSDKELSKEEVIKLYSSKKRLNNE